MPLSLLISTEARIPVKSLNGPDSFLGSDNQKCRAHNMLNLQQQQKRTLGATPKNRKLRLQFTHAYQNWTPEDWKMVDESRFRL